jgi:hypothetical protein
MEFEHYEPEIKAAQPFFRAFEGEECWRASMPQLDFSVAVWLPGIHFEGFDWGS